MLDTSNTVQQHACSPGAAARARELDRDRRLLPVRHVSLGSERAAVRPQRYGADGHALGRSGPVSSRP